MIDSSEIITKIIIALLVIYTSIKFIAPLIQLFWEKIFYRPQKSNVNIDILIERQKQILRNGAVKKESTPFQSQKRLDKTTAAYQNHLQKLMTDGSKESESIDDVKKIFSLFDNLQWGEGLPFENIKKKIKEEFHVTIEQWEITSILKDILKHDFLLSRKGTNLPAYREIMEILELAVIINKIFNESIIRKGPLLERLSSTWKMPSSDIIKGFCLVLHREKPSSIKILQGILNQTTIVDKKNSGDVFKILTSDDKKFFQKKNLFLKNLYSKSEFFSILSPLEVPKDKNNLECARRIFCINEKTSLEDIKKIYKNLASKRHPDKLSSYGAPSEFESIATKNFSIIQQAYDIILNEHKKYENN